MAPVDPRGGLVDDVLATPRMLAPDAPDSNVVELGYVQQHAQDS